MAGQAGGGFCSTWNILGNQPKAGNVPRGTKPTCPKSGVNPNWNTHPIKSNSRKKITGVFHHKPLPPLLVQPLCPPCASPSPSTASPLTAGQRRKRFPQPGLVLHSATTYPQSALPFNLDCHGQDSRHCQPKRRSWQNHHSHQPCCLPGDRRPQDPPCRLRPSGQRYLWTRLPAR